MKIQKNAIHLEYVIYYQEKGQWREQRLTQKFARGGGKNKVAESFKKEVQEERLFGNFTVLLCGETNILNYKMATKKIEDQYKFSKILDKDIRVILNPIHDKMSRHEMKLQRKYLSKHKGGWFLFGIKEGQIGMVRLIRIIKTPMVGTYISTEWKRN